MTYKDSIFEMFMAAQMHFAAGQLYAANLLFCACFELLGRANSTGRLREIDRVMSKIETYMDGDTARAAFEELNEATGKFKDFQEYKVAIQDMIRNKLVKPAFGKVPFADLQKAIDKNWKVYNQTKHGPEQGTSCPLDLDTEMAITLTTEDVNRIEKCVGRIIAIQYPNDIKKRFGI